MLKKRIIPCLDIQNGRTVKGVNFVGLRDAGDPVELAQKYVVENADELVFLDISATVEKRKTLIDLVKDIASEINIPFTVGGGIRTVQDVEELIRAGADKVSINSAAVKHPNLIKEVSDAFGSQCLVVAIDIKFDLKNWYVYLNGGRLATNLEALAWTRQVSDLGAGEILLTSMIHDGTKSGFALEITQAVSEEVNLPVIASGGAGKLEHFKDLFTKTSATGGLAASIFHFNEVPIPVLKDYLKNEKIPIR